MSFVVSLNVPDGNTEAKIAPQIPCNGPDFR